MDFYDLLLAKKLSGGAEPQPEPQPTLKLIYETTIAEWVDDGDGGYTAYADNDPTVQFSSVITVDYDGTRYKDIHARQDDPVYCEYGAVWDTSNYKWDFSDYPFVIVYENDPQHGTNFSAHVSTDATHTFEVYVDVDN